MDAIAGTTMHRIGELCLAGDWACTCGDLEALENIARQLAAYAHEPLHGKLAGLADMCRLDPDNPDNAVAAWMHLKEQILGDNGSPPP